MSIGREWAHATDGPELLRPNEVAALAEACGGDNDAREYGLDFCTGSDGCTITGSLDQLEDVGKRILRVVEAERQRYGVFVLGDGQIIG